MFQFHWKERWALLRLKSDWRSVLFALIAFAIHLGFGSGMASANALLISRVGTQPLFYVYFACSILTFVSAGLIYYWVDRHSRTRVFFLSFEGFAASILFLWWIMGRADHATWPFFTARIASDVFYVLCLLQFWLLAGDHFNNLEAKLRFPLFVAAGALGFMLGGLLLQGFAQRWQAVNFLPVWAALLALVPLALPLLPVNQAPPKRAIAASHEDSAVLRSALRLLKVLFIFWLGFTFLSYGVDYLFNSVALRQIPDENQLAAFFGKVAFFSFLAVFIFQIFFAGRLAMRFSVESSIWLFCLLLFFGACLLALSPSLATAAVSEGLVFYFLDSKAVALLQPVSNLFPDRLRGRAKVLLDGFAPSAGDLLLLILAFALSYSIGIQAMPYLLAGIACLFLLFPLIFRNAYLRFLTDCLKQSDPKLLLNAVQALGEQDKKTATGALLDLMQNTPSVFLKKHILLSLGRMRNEAVLPKLVEQFAVPQESLQLAVIEALGSFRNYPSLFALYELMKSQDNVSFQVRMNATQLMTRLVGHRMIPLLKSALLEADERIQANAIESLALLRDKNTVPLLLPYLNHVNRRLRANAAIALYPFREYRDQARATVAELFQSQNGLTRFAGIYAIGELALWEYHDALRKLLTHADARHRHQVLTALAKMGVAEFIEAFVETLLDPDENLALESLRSLSRFPRHSRWRTFEKISKLERNRQEILIARLEESPFDFSQERELLITSNTIFGAKI